MTSWMPKFAPDLPLVPFTFSTPPQLKVGRPSASSITHFSEAGASQPRPANHSKGCSYAPPLSVKRQRQSCNKTNKPAIGGATV